MSLEYVTVEAGGFAYSGFTKVSIQGGANQAAWTFSLETNDPASEDWAIPCGSPAIILASGEPMIVGYVEDFEPQFDATTHTVKLSGRSRSLDIVDCSAKHETGRFENKTTLDIATELDHYGVGFSADVPLKPMPWNQIRQGETVFQTLDRQLRDQGAFMQGMPDGSIVITKGGKGGRHKGALVQGENILSGSAKHSEKGRYSDYEVKGQSSLGTGKERQQPYAAANDKSVSRYRNKLVINEGETDIERAGKRVKGEANRSAGRGQTAEITIAGWRLGGALIVPNKLVYIVSSKLRLDGDMLIKSVTFEQGATEGTTAKISLVDPRTLDGDETSDGGGSNGKEWGIEITEPGW